MRMPHRYKNSLTALALSGLLILPSSSAQNVTTSSGTSTSTSAAISQLHLYRALFHFVSQMERDRLANPPTQLVNMVEIEDRLRRKMNLSSSEWQVLLNASIKVDTYRDETYKQAHALASQTRAASRQDPITSANTLADGRARLQKMQADLDSRMLSDIKDLETSVGTDATTKIHAYLNGSLSVFAQVLPRTVHKKAAQ